MTKFGTYGKINTHPDQRDDLVPILLEAAKVLKSFEGCELYIVNVSETEPETIWVTEVWKDAEAHQASFAIEEVKALIQRGRPMIAGMEATRLIPIGGKGI